MTTTMPAGPAPADTRSPEAAPAGTDPAGNDPAGTDPAAFERLLDAHGPAMARLARRYADGEDWRDLLQEMHLQLWRALPGFDGRASEGTWVYRVALNTALSHVRRPRNAHVPMREAHEPGNAGDPRDPLHLLDDFLSALDPIQRAVLLLDLEGLTREQIGEVTGLSANAVAVRRTRLRQAFERRYIEEAD